MTVEQWDDSDEGAEVAAVLDDAPPAGALAGMALAAGLPAPEPVPARRFADFDAHEWSVLLPLAFIGFFINYDTSLLTMAAPKIAAGLGVDVGTFSVGVAVLRVAALGSMLTLRLADRWGRRKVLLVSVIGFTIATGLTTLAWSLAAFVAIQTVARVFLSTEETLGGVVLTEELRADRRGRGISTLGVMGMGGFGLSAVMLLFVDATPLGWRILYAITLLPLFVVLYLRRNLGETRAFTVAAGGGRVQHSFWPRTSATDRARLVRLVVMITFEGAFATAAFFYAADLAQNGFKWTGTFTLVILGAAPMTFLGFLAGGRLSDLVGRRPVVAVVMVTFLPAIVLAYSGSPTLFVFGFYLIAAGEAAMQASRASYIGELFPTEVRATLAAFIGVVAVLAGSLGLLLVEALKGTFEPTTTVIALGALTAASAVLLRGLPETHGTDVIGSPAA